MTHWQPWWPVSDEETERVLRQLRTAAARFLTELAGASAALRVLDAGTRSDGLPSDRAFRFGEHVRVSTSSDAMRRLARVALQAPDETAIGDADALLERFTERALAELARRMIRAAGREPGSATLEDAGTEEAPVGKPLHDVVVGDPTGALVRIAFWRGLFRNTAVRTETRTFAPLTAREDALKNLSIEVSATVGRASLSFDEITSLAPGDVILLDRTVSAPIDVVAESPQVALASGFPCRSGRQRAVQLTAAVD
jgi:flagellar motor switch/type III secretory pathway protein FliN